MSSLVQRHLVDTPGGTVHLRVAGAQQAGAPVVLFHQSPSSSRMWIGVMERLAAAGFPSAAPDMLDYGHSDPQTRQLTMVEHADLLLAAAESVVGRARMLVGHHTGAVFATAAAAGSDTVRGVAVFGYPLYTSWREKLERLGARLDPDRFGEDGRDVADLWVNLNASIEPETPDEIRHAILVDRLRAGPLWYTAYAALMAADLDAPIRAVADSGIELATVFARSDALSRLEPGITELTGVEPIWIEGGPWVTLEHPDRAAKPLIAMAERLA